MKLIDAKKKLTYQSIVDFKADQSDETLVDVVSEMTDVAFSTTIGDLEKFFKRDDVIATYVEDKDVISFLSKDTLLEILGLDFKWYVTPVRGIPFKRLEKLFNHSETKEDSMNNSSTITEKKTVNKTVKSSKPTLSITCAISENDELVNVTVFEGSKQEVIDFANKYYMKSYIRHRFEDVVRFKINDRDNWQTFDELKEEGVFL